MNKNPTTVFEQCGTTAGWSAHQSNYQRACDRCRKAQANYRQICRIASGSTENIIVPVAMLIEMLATGNANAITVRKHLGKPVLYAIQEKAKSANDRVRQSGRSATHGSDQVGSRLLRETQR